MDILKTFLDKGSAAYLGYLDNQNVKVTAQTQAQVAEANKAAGMFASQNLTKTLLIGGGILVGLFVLVMVLKKK